MFKFENGFFCELFMGKIILCIYLNVGVVCMFFFFVLLMFVFLIFCFISGFIVLFLLCLFYMVVLLVLLKICYGSTEKVGWFGIEFLSFLFFVKGYVVRKQGRVFKQGRRWRRELVIFLILKVDLVVDVFKYSNGDSFGDEKWRMSVVFVYYW